MSNELKVSFYIKRESRLEKSNPKEHVNYPIIGKIIIGNSIAQFIKTRADIAAEAYSDAIKDGYSHDRAEEMASKALYEGLLFFAYCDYTSGNLMSGY